MTMELTRDKLFSLVSDGDLDLYDTYDSAPVYVDQDVNPTLSSYYGDITDVIVAYDELESAKITLYEQDGKAYISILNDGTKIVLEIREQVSMERVRLELQKLK